MGLSVQQQLRLYLVILVIAIPAQGLKRTIGPPHDRRFVKAANKCNATTSEAFEYRICSDTIDCIYDHLTEAFKANLASGTSIVALLPTILALIGEPSTVFMKMPCV